MRKLQAQTKAEEERNALREENQARLAAAQEALDRLTAQIEDRQQALERAQQDQLQAETI